MANTFDPDPQDKTVITILRLCFRDAFLRGGSGVLIGTLLSMFFINRKRWPIVVGLGIGMGFSWANCRIPMAKEFNPDPNDRSVITTLRICFYDAIFVGGSGALFGTIASMFVLNRQRWPVIVGLGIGMGYSWANCQ